MRTIPVLFFILVLSFQCTKSTPVEANPLKISGGQLTPKMTPAFIGKSNINLYELKFLLDGSAEKPELKNITINFTPESQPDCISSLTVANSGMVTTIFGTSQNIGLRTSLSGSRILVSGTSFFSLNFDLKSDVKLTKTFEIQNVELTFSDNQTLKVKPDSKFVYRPTILLRAEGQDDVNTYRIPGLATTTKGTLIAVYDARNLKGGDLQGDIDVGMNRSTDGGQTWSAMKRVLDMGDYNGLPQEQNGVGDPAVLVDQTTNTIWVAGLWVNGIPGQTAWNGSKPGLEPGVTGQFVLTKSDDDGVTWSQPINITKQCKKPEWNLFFQGPGKGITLTDGTLVFPAQYKDAHAMPYSTIIYSKDHGKTWSVGTGAKSNTTEAQVVQLSDGSLMLNMRDNRNVSEKGDQNGRAVAITKDMGQSWTVHSSSNSALPESNCQGSLISAKVLINGNYKDVLFFTNPNVKSTRAHMTIKASLDQGVTWPVEYQAELNSADSFGYSCLTMVNESTIGILFEGTKDLYFQEIKVVELLNNLAK
ncbi:MAG: sialidase family protein [Prolixibacteraceae bacterium]